MSSLSARLSRGHLLSRGAARATREARSAFTTLVLSLTRPRPGHTAVVTLNSYEENASVQALSLSISGRFKTVTFLSPNPDIAKWAVRAAAIRLKRPIPTTIRYVPLGYGALLTAYRRSAETFSTHVLMPGRDLSRRRRHVHLTHGSGPKPDTTFRSPANVLASITPQWISQQLEEYGLPHDTEIVPELPRLEIMKSAIGDKSVVARLGLDTSLKLVVWAPTYRKSQRGRELRVSGVPHSKLSSEDQSGLSISDILDHVTDSGGQLVLKIHPEDIDTFGETPIPLFTSEDLQRRGVTSYELFGAADLVITDYSSIYLERQELGLPFALYCPDLDEFMESYRGFRQPFFLNSATQVQSVSDLSLWPGIP